MNNHIFNLEDISLATILADINTKQLSGSLEIRKNNKESIITLWFSNNTITAVTGTISVLEKIQSYNWLNSQLIVALRNDNLQEKAIGEKLSKVYNLKPEQIKQLFQEQIKELYNLFSLDKGTVEFKENYNSANLPYSEITGCDIKIATVISEGLKKNHQRYLDDFPETCLTINSTNQALDNIELDNIDLAVLQFANSNKTVKQIARELKIPILELQRTAYFLKLMDRVEFSLSTNRLLELKRNNKSAISNNKITNFEYHQNWKTPLIAISCLNLLIIILTAGGFFVGAERGLLDRFFRWRGTTPNKNITIVTVNDQDIEKFPSYPIADEYLAQALQNIKKHKPKVIGLDIYRNLPQPPGNEKLQEVYRHTDNLIGIKKIAGNKVSPAPILAKKKQTAFSDLIVDSDNVVRRSLLSIEDKNGNNLSLGTYLALFTLSQENIVMKNSNQDEYILGKSLFKALDSHSDGYWQANDFNGLQTLLNYQHQTKDFNQISFWDIYKNRIPTELIYNKIILIGVTADSAKDFVYTPFSKNKTGLAEPVPGVIIHANIAAQLLSVAKGEAPMLKVFNKFTAVLLIAGFSLFGIVVGIISLKFYINITKENQQIILVIQGILLSVIVLSISYICFLEGLWIPTISSLLAASLSSLAINSQYKQQLENLVYADQVTKTANRKYFNQIFNTVFNNAKKQDREIALLFCKIRNNNDSPNNSLEQNKKLKVIAKAILDYRNEDDIVARYDRNSLAIIFQNVDRQQVKELISLIKNKIKLYSKELNTNFEVDFNWTTNNNLTSPIDFLMLAIYNQNELFIKD